jgi:uncharacterized protein YecE (DUF72 family)
MGSPVAIPLVGCSGWNYKSWRGPFYPPELPASRWLPYYASHFETVEINNTFYRLPEAATFAGWRAQTDEHFVMAVKGSRFLTHMKRLRHPEEPLQRLFSRASALGSRFGPVLYQLPPNFRRDLDRLGAFLQALPKTWDRRRMRHAIEFRDRSWYVGEVFQLLERHDVALCLHDKRDSPITKPFVGPFAYVRFHGTSGEYRGSYSVRQLDKWAHGLAEQSQDGRPVFAYFNNDPDAVATSNAATLNAAIHRVLGITPKRNERRPGAELNRSSSGAISTGGSLDEPFNLICPMWPRS